MFLISPALKDVPISNVSNVVKKSKREGDFGTNNALRIALAMSSVIANILFAFRNIVAHLCWGCWSCREGFSEAFVPMLKEQLRSMSVHRHRDVCARFGWHAHGGQPPHSKCMLCVVYMDLCTGVLLLALVAVSCCGCFCF